jgi:hypothetical protein
MDTSHVASVSPKLQHLGNANVKMVAKATKAEIIKPEEAGTGLFCLEH